MLTTKDHILKRKIIMLERNKNIPAIAQKLKKQPSAVHMTIYGKRTNKKTQLAICKILKVTKEEFWPEFYPNGDGSVSHDAKISDRAGVVN